MKQKKNNVTLWLSLLQFCYWTLAFVVDGVYASFLKSLGYDESFIGKTLVLTGLAGIVLLPVSGFIADKFSNFRLMVGGSMLLMGGMLPIVLLLPKNKLVVYLYAVIGGGFNKVTSGLADSWLNKLSKTHGGINFGRIRSIGSISYAVMSALLARLFAAFGYSICSYIAFLLIGAAFICVWQLPNPEVSGDEGESRPSFAETVKYLISSRSYLVYLLCMVVMNITTQAFFSFFALLAQEVGGSVSAVGTAYLLLAFVEFWVVRYISEISSKIGITKTVGFGMIGNFFKSFIHSLANSPAALYCCSITQGFSFALVTPGAPLFLRDNIDSRYLSSAQLIGQTFSTSMVPFIFSGLYGSTAQSIGVKGMLRVFSVPAMVAGILFLILAPMAIAKDKEK